MANKGAAGLVRLLVPAGQASPSPPVGPALGARGVKSMDFCKEFNARTSSYAPGVPVPTYIDVQADRTFTFVTRTPPTAYFLKKAAGIPLASGTPLSTKAVYSGENRGQESGTVTLKHIYEIARIKQSDDHMKHLPLKSVASAIVAVCKNIGLRVVR